MDITAQRYNRIENAAVSPHIPDDYETLRRLYISVLEENRWLRGLLRGYGMEFDLDKVRSVREESLQETHPTSTEAIKEQPVRLNEVEMAEVSKQSSLEEKAQLFISLFCGREDVYASRWEKKDGRSGYSPVCRNLWRKGLCKKPKMKCPDCPNPDYRPFDISAAQEHLSGDKVLGSYAILQDDTCRFLAIDLDEESWRNDAILLQQLCSEKRIPFYIEISRSGNGAHIWFFLSERVEAAYARRFASRLIEVCMQQNPRMTFKSLNRMFPNQDTMPKGGFGNLIALPLQREAVKKTGGSLFVDENFAAYPDQWKYLSHVKRISKDDIAVYMDDMGDVMVCKEIKEDEQPWEKVTDTLPTSDSTKEISCILADRLYIRINGVSARAQSQIKRLAAFSNPEFYRMQAMRQFIPIGTPRVICCAEYLDNYLCLPRGCLDSLQAWAEKNKITLSVEDKRNAGEPINVKFKGELREEQRPAFEALNKFDCGVLSATTAFGKTVIAAALIASKKVNTLVIVQRKQLMAQWKSRLSTFLDISEIPGRQGKAQNLIGSYGAGKDARSGIIDIAIQQSLGKKDDVKEWIKDYGMVIVDECHHVPAPTFEQVLQKVSAKYFYGLSATPTRKDGHHPVTTMYLGKIRYRVDARAEAQKRPFEHIMIPRFTGTDFDMGDDKAPTVTQLYSQIVRDDLRNHLIVDDVLSCVKEGRNCLILSERVQHVKFLANLLSPHIEKVHVLVGGTAKKETDRQMMELRDAPESSPLVICATGRYVGEGFDEARLDTLFLTMPISWQGTLAQYAGRLHRLHEGKQEVRIYDYIDSKSEMLDKMYQKRLKAYASLGYRVGTGSGENSRSSIYDAGVYETFLRKDLEDARRSIIISSPYLSAHTIRRLQPSLADAANRGLRVAISTKEMDVYKKSATAVQNAISNLARSGVKIEQSNGTYLKYAVIDGQICWYGSISVLGQAAEQESMMRLTSGTVAKMLMENGFEKKGVEDDEGI